MLWMTHNWCITYNDAYIADVRWYAQLMLDEVQCICSVQWWAIRMLNAEKLLTFNCWCSLLTCIADVHWWRSMMQPLDDAQLFSMMRKWRLMMHMWLMHILMSVNDTCTYICWIWRSSLPHSPLMRSCCSVASNKVDIWRPLIHSSCMLTWLSAPSSLWLSSMNYQTT